MITRQAARALRLRFPERDGPAAEGFEAVRLEVDEALSRDFEVRIEALSERPDIGPGELLGRSVTVELRREDGSVRHFNGRVAECRLLRSTHRHGVYRLVLRPWLALLRLRTNHRIFHGLNVEQQTRTLLDEHRCTDWRHDALDGDRETR